MSQSLVSNKEKQREKAEYFRSLHRGPHILVLPNAWDAASAKMFERAGFDAGNDVACRTNRRRNQIERNVQFCTRHPVVLQGKWLFRKIIAKGLESQNQGTGNINEYP